MAFTKDRSIRALYPVTARRDRYGLAYEVIPQLKTLVRTRTGDRNPRWKDQVRKQQNATTAMSGVFEDLEATVGGATINVGPSTQINSSSGYLAVSQLYAWWVPSISVPVADARAMQMYLKNAAEAQTRFQGLVFIGELRETIRMIRSPAKSLSDLIGRYYKDLRDKKRTLGDKRWRRSLSGIWLEHAFGWKPLLSDIESAVAAYEQHVLRPNQIPISGYGVNEGRGPANYNNGPQNLNFPTNCGNWVVSRMTKEAAVVRYRGMVTSTNNATLWGDRKLFGFSPEQFLPTAWELLPWSFLIDYFTNIGDIITATVVDKESIAWTNRSETVFRYQDVSMLLNEAATKASFPDYRSHSSTGSTAKARIRTVVRSPGVGLYVPPLEFSLPGKPAQWTNMTALLAQFDSLHPQKFRR